MEFARDFSTATEERFNTVFVWRAQLYNVTLWNEMINVRKQFFRATDLEYVFKAIAVSSFAKSTMRI